VTFVTAARLVNAVIYIVVLFAVLSPLAVATAIAVLELAGLLDGARGTGR
jgi:hypothetical protein